MKLLVILTLILSCVPIFAQVNLLSHDTGIWSLSSKLDRERWIIIHNLEEAQKTKIFHIELISRKIGSPKWDIKREVKHLAITQKALEKSILKPLEKGSVYPEAFDEAYTEWQSKNSGKGGKVCSTSINDYLKLILQNKSQ